VLKTTWSELSLEQTAKTDERLKYNTTVVQIVNKPPKKGDWVINSFYDRYQSYCRGIGK